MTRGNAVTPIENALVLSVFPGIDLLGQAFEEQGFCVVRGPDIITGGDIRKFHPPPNRFDAVIGGPPCQDFSSLNRNPGGEYGLEMLAEFIRVVEQAAPRWFLFENVVRAPEFCVPGYHAQRFVLDLAWFTPYSRRRDFVFGIHPEQHGPPPMLDPLFCMRNQTKGYAVNCSDERSFSACCEIQGLPADFDLPSFTLTGKKKAVGNAVPLALGRYVAALIAKDIYGVNKPETYEQAECRPIVRRCDCGCGRAVVGKAFYASATCRKRAQRKRDMAR